MSSNAPMHAAVAIDTTKEPAPPELDDLCLRRAKRGDPRSFRVLVERYHRPVHDLLWRMLEPAGVEQRVEGLSQETFVRVHRALGRFDARGPARLSTWILTIASRLALNELRRKRPARVPLERAEGLAGRSRPDVELERARLAARVRGALAELKPDHRAVLVLREYHDLGYDEIARVLEVDLGTVKSRLSRARAAVRQALQKRSEEGYGG